MSSLKPAVLAITLALGALSATAPASAATFVYRHYVLGMTASPTSQAQQAASSIVVALASASLPAGRVNVAYSYDLSSLLSVTGDSGTYDPAGVSWGLGSGALPDGLTLNNGVISGVPAAYNPGSSFQVQATYKSKSGQQVFAILVNDVVLHVTQISVGGRTTCAVTTTGGAKCWGFNLYGQLGNNTAVDSMVPVDVVGLSSGVASISAGSNTTCAVTSAGGAKCWGYNNLGQLGDNSTTTRYTPVDVSGLTSGVASISVGGGLTCAVTSAGGAKCWGFNSVGQVGDNTTTTRYTPVDVYGLTSGVASISVGVGAVCAVTSAGGAKCWGNNSQGQLGDNTTTTRYAPVEVYGLASGVTHVSAATNFACAVTTSGGAKCWGINGTGQLGDNTTTTRYTPVDVYGLTSGVASISAGANYTCAVTTAGGAKCWGSNGQGQLGDNSTSASLVPVDVAGLTSGVSSISAGASVAANTCAVTSLGEAKCWGVNGVGQLGNNSTTSATSPVSVVNP